MRTWNYIIDTHEADMQNSNPINRIASSKHCRSPLVAESTAVLLAITKALERSYNHICTLSRHQRVLVLMGLISNGSNGYNKHFGQIEYAIGYRVLPEPNPNPKYLRFSYFSDILEIWVGFRLGILDQLQSGFQVWLLLPMVTFTHAYAKLTLWCN